MRAPTLAASRGGPSGRRLWLRLTRASSRRLAAIAKGSDREILKRDFSSRIACPRTLALFDTVVDGSNPQEPVNLHFPGDDLFTPYERRRGLQIGPNRPAMLKIRARSHSTGWDVIGFDRDV